MKRKLAYIFVVLLCFSLSSFFPLKRLAKEGIANHEYALKLAFIKQFPLFITWPEKHVKKRKKMPFTIGVYGINKFREFNEDFEIRIIQGRPVKIVDIKKPSDIHQTDILFISNTTKKELTKIIEQAQQHHVLTIADKVGMAQKGVMINFFIEKNTVRFELNRKSLNTSQFKVSSKLWRIAKVIYQ